MIYIWLFGVVAVIVGFHYARGGRKSRGAR